ncbi:hypothetical protein K458DRAFT_383945 [Lentithecium fluviatile CBS 122367]|uniref:Uncharacterized protein n=1 Tax=Lentithecium fluviatile CBS 122367 TaxID=1168545 RepID=A0A6G1JFS5_9PLEO|nr:hypothetical protein K458DRAFT_383945 [Lentithecium fluviatile CBS 122367]
MEAPSPTKHENDEEVGDEAEKPDLSRHESMCAHRPFFNYESENRLAAKTVSMRMPSRKCTSWPTRPKRHGTFSASLQQKRRIGSNGDGETVSKLIGLTSYALLMPLEGVKLDGERKPNIQNLLQCGVKRNSLSWHPKAGTCFEDVGLNPQKSTSQMPKLLEELDGATQDTDKGALKGTQKDY